MPDPVSPVVVILLSVALGLLGVLVWMGLGIWRRVARMDRRLAEMVKRQDEEDAGSSSATAEATAGGAFEAFLNEDAARRELPKGEQFAAYRRWRQQQGMNWTKP